MSGLGRLVPFTVRSPPTNGTRVRQRLSLLLSSAVAVTSLVAAAAQASPADGYSGTHFGDGNLPAGCIKDMSPTNPANSCFHMKVGLNALDSPQIDVAVLVPASPTAERDMRIMRQAVEAWEGGISYLSGEMDLPWLQNGVHFHITVDEVDLTGDQGGEFTTYPLYDPEIVVLATNPVGGAGIGIDPVNATEPVLQVFGQDGDVVPCHNIVNPFDMSFWEAIPGFDSHHDGRGGTYTEDCGGAGGNVCFSVNTGIDPVPGKTDLFALYDLVLHETGHCLTLGHVGDGAETPAWGPVPTNDIMSYSQDPQGQSKCVSTLDVEGFALRMSRYLDVNGDGAVYDNDRLVANDVAGNGTNAFQVQNPGDHLYASSTGSVWDCPQPDLALLPGAPRTDWTPDPAGAPAPPGPTGSVADPDGDATSPVTDIHGLDVSVTPTAVVGTLQLATLWSPLVSSPVSYSVFINGRRFDTYITYPTIPPTTQDSASGAFLPVGTTTWDAASNTVTFKIPRSYLAGFGIASPYAVRGQASVGSYGFAALTDDQAPDRGVVQVAAPPA